jgi:cytochrome c553
MRGRARFGTGLALTALTVAFAAASVPAPGADLEAGRKKAEPCAACHGPDGNATIPGTPSLAGMPAFYTHWQLIMYRDGRRRDPQMSPFGINLSDADMADLAAYYAAQPPRRRPAASTPRAPPLGDRCEVGGPGRAAAGRVTDYCSNGFAAARQRRPATSTA